MVNPFLLFQPFSLSTSSHCQKVINTAALLSQQTLWYTITAPINPESLMQTPPEMKTHTPSLPWIAQALPTTREPGQSSCLSSYSSPFSLAATSSHLFSFPPPSPSLSCVSNRLASSLGIFLFFFVSVSWSLC